MNREIVSAKDEARRDLALAAAAGAQPTVAPVAGGGGGAAAAARRVAPADGSGRGRRRRAPADRRGRDQAGLRRRRGLTVVGSAGDAGGVGSDGVAGGAGWSGVSSLMRASYATGRAGSSTTGLASTAGRSPTVGHDVRVTGSTAAAGDAPGMRDRGFCNQCGTVYAPGRRRLHPMLGARCSTTS